MKHKHIRLFSFLIASVSLLALSACETSARYSEHFDWEGTLTQENKTEDSVTIKFSLTYNGEVQDASNWATLYAQGSWTADEETGVWADPVALTWVSESQTYDLTLTDVSHGDYECQLLFGYTHLETYNWDYRVTAEGSNLSVAIDSSEVTVPVTLDKEVTSIIPEYKAELSGYTLSFTFKYGEGTATVPSYADVYIAGSWDNEGESWNTFHALTPGDNNTYTYSISETALKAGETYTYGLVLVYSGDTPSWTYEVKTSDYESLYIYGTEGDNHIESIEIVLNEEFSTTIPEPINNYELTISISYNNTTEYIPDYVDLYISGDFNDWSQNDKITSISNDRYSFTYTISTVHVGTEYKYQIFAVASGEGFSDSNALSISGDDWINSSFTVSSGESSQTIVFAATRSISSLVTDPNLESYTVVIKLLNHNGTASIGAPTGEYKLFINSEYDSWGTHQLTYNETDDTYSYSYSAKPSTAGNYETSIYIGTSSEDCWDNKLATFNITSTGNEEKVHTYETISITTAYDSISDIFTSSTYTVTIGDLGQAPERIVLYVAGDFNGYYDATGTDWQGFSWGDEVSLTRNNDETTYNLSLSFTPAVGSSIELIGYDSEGGESAGNEWNHEHIADYTFTGNESGSFTMTTTHSAWSEVFTGLADNATDFYVVLLNTDSTGTSTLSSKLTTMKSQDTDWGSNWTDESIFNNSVTTSLTSATTGDGQDCVYNSVAGTVVPNTNHAVYLYDNSWSNEIDIHFVANDTSTAIPETGEGEYAVYLCGANGSDLSSKSASTSFSDGTTGGWQIVSSTNYPTIANYVESLEYRGTQGGTGGDTGGGGSTETDSGYYYFIFDVNLTTSLSAITTLGCGSNCFGGSSSSGVISGTTSAGQLYVYNSVAGSYPTYTGGSGTDGSDWFTFYSGNWDNQLALNTLTCPTISDGQLAIYVGVGINSNGSDQVWAGNTNIPGYNSSNGAWVTSYNSLSAFLNDCTSTINSIWN